jgi:hypothetical protein
VYGGCASRSIRGAGFARHPCRATVVVCRRGVQRFDRPGLPDGVLASEERGGLATDRGREVLGLQAVRVHALELDPFRSLPGAAQLDHRREAVPRVAGEQRARRPHDLQLAPRRHVDAGVEVSQDAGVERHRAGECDVHLLATDRLCRGHAARLATGEQPRRVDAVAAHVHQRATVERGGEPHVRRLGQRKAEGGADQA